LSWLLWFFDENLYKTECYDLFIVAFTGFNQDLLVTFQKEVLFFYRADLLRCNHEGVLFLM
jgi:hypothetical protein